MYNLYILSREEKEMTTPFYDMLNISSPIAIVIISVACMLIFGFAMTRITKLLRLPNVTAYIIAGILIGPYVLNIVPKGVISGMDFLADIALAFIAFSTGEFFRVSTLKKSGAKVIIITLLEALMASVLVFIVTYFIFHLTIEFSLVLAALASATAPASTMMTIRQTQSKGEFVETLLQVVALDDVVALIAYSIAISYANVKEDGIFKLTEVLLPIGLNIASLVVGGLFGFLLSLILKRRSTDNRLIVAIALLFAFCGLCNLFDVSPLLGCMAMSSVYINVSNDDKLFKQLNYFSPPILLLFFVRSGANFNLGALFSPAVGGSTIPIILIGVVYFVVRILGKYSGAFAGGLITKSSKEIRNFLGLALIPQAGVAIGLAAMGARILKGNMGFALETIILASSVLYELIGPGCAKLSLFLSHSYSKKLDDIVPDSALEIAKTNENDAKPMTEVEKLIAKIDKINKELPKHDQKPYSEEEQAFLEAAEAQQAAYLNERRKNRRK